MISIIKNKAISIAEILQLKIFGHEMNIMINWSGA